MNQNKKEIVKEIFSPVIKKFQRIQIQTHYKSKFFFKKPDICSYVSILPPKQTSHMKNK